MGHGISGDGVVAAGLCSVAAAHFVAATVFGRIQGGIAALDHFIQAVSGLVEIQAAYANAHGDVANRCKV